MKECCQDCVYWDGDSLGTRGYCLIDDDILVITGRFEDCVRFLARVLEIPIELN